jgi:hypothetical protein
VGEPADLPPLMIHLHLAELVELNEVIEHARSSLIKKGAPFAKDPKRPQTVLKIVKERFRPLGKAIDLRLGSGIKSQRFLKAAFAWGLDPDVGGVSAKGITRTRLGRFNRMAADQGTAVTGYVFEGVIGNWIVEYLGGRSSNINYLFGTVIAHELGHQLGLDHTKSVANMMFGFGEGSKTDRTKWLRLADKKALGFTVPQIKTMKILLPKP